MADWTWDVAPLIAYAFAVQPKTYRDIDLFYKSLFDDHLNNDYLSRNPWKDSRLFKRDSADVEIYANKILCITQYIYETNDKKAFDKLCNIAQKHYEAYHKYATRQAKRPPLIKFLSHFNLRNKSNADLMTALGMILLFLQNQNKIVNVTDKESKTLYRTIGVKLECYNRPMISYITKQNKEKVQTLLKTLQDEYGKINSLSNFTSSPHYINNSFYLFLEKISELDSLPLEALQLYRFSDDDLCEICAVYSVHFPIQNLFDLNKFNLFHCFMIALIVRSYGRKYADAKERILHQQNQLELLENTSLILNELEKEKKKTRRLEKRIAAQDECTQELQSIIDQETVKSTERIKDATQAIRNEILAKQQRLNESEIEKSRQLITIHKLENEIALMNDKIDTLKNQNLNLQNIISGLSTATSHKQVRLDSMRGKKVAVIGGHAKWIAKLQLTCPNFIYIGVDKLNFDSSILKNAEQIAICYLYMNHALYRKVIEYARKTQIPVAYVKYSNDILYIFS